MMKKTLMGGAAALALVAVTLTAFAETPKVTEAEAAPTSTEAPAAETAPDAAAAGESPTVVVKETPTVLAADVHSVANVGGDIAIRWTEATTDLWFIPEEHLASMCWKGRVFELGGIDGVAPVAMKVEGNVLSVGSKTVEVACPLPAGYQELGWAFEQRAAEHSAEGEFTDAHLRALIAVMEQAEPTLFTPQRVKGYTSGGDHHMVVAALEQHLGQFPAYVLEVDNLMYVVPMTEKLAACGGTCTEPRLVVWHLHKHVYVAKKKKSPPRVSTPKPPRPTPDGGITMICSDDCK